MREYDNFRVILAYNVASHAWDVELCDDCVKPALAGKMGTMQVSFTNAQLQRLRSQNGWPDINELQTIGTSIGSSLMTPDLKAAFKVCLAEAQAANHGLRVIISMVGAEQEIVNPGVLRLQELPFESIYGEPFKFLAPNPETPISRSLSYTPTFDPFTLTLPLRILVAVATPNDKPHADMQTEKDGIQKALQELIDTRAVILEFCEHATREKLTTHLRKGFHVLHFIGHGSFEIEGADAAQQAYLCLEDENGDSDPMSALTLENLLVDKGVKLVVITACSSAAATPNDVQKSVGPFDGVAQALIAGNSKVSAVVAMQFDLESTAAVTFSKAFYQELITSSSRLDEVVALCRQSLVTEMEIGHRAWITPVVYWRCKDGKVFDITPSTKKFTEQQQRALQTIEILRDTYRESIVDVSKLSPNQQAAAVPLVQKWQLQLDDLDQQRGDILGETLRLRGGPITPGGTRTCLLSFRVRMKAMIGNVKVVIHYPADKLRFTHADAGVDTPGNAPLTLDAPGALTVLIPNTSGGAEWDVKEYELAQLTFEALAGITDPILELNLESGDVEKDNQSVTCAGLSALLFVAQPN